MIFHLVPYVSVGPLRFGMSHREVVDAVGEPLYSSKSRRGDSRLSYATFIPTLDLNEILFEVTFIQGAKLIVDGCEIFASDHALEELMVLDPEPVEDAGILFFPRLGISTTGFHTPDEKAVTAIRKGLFDRHLPDMKPYKAPIAEH